MNEDIEIRGKRKTKSALIAVVVIILIVIFIAVFVLLFNPKVTYEGSMEDTLVPKDTILLSVNAYRSAEVSFRDIIVFDSMIPDPDGGVYEICSRVIGVPRDVIEIKDGIVFRNGEALDEPYTKDGSTLGTMPVFLIPEGMYFVLGDNRQDSVDSRDPRVGLVLENEINGRVVFRILPISSFGKIN